MIVFLIGLTIVILALIAVFGFFQAKGRFGRWIAPYIICVVGGLMLALIEVLFVEYLMFSIGYR